MYLFTCFYGANGAKTCAIARGEWWADRGGSDWTYYARKCDLKSNNFVTWSILFSSCLIEKTQKISQRNIFLKS